MRIPTSFQLLGQTITVGFDQELGRAAEVVRDRLFSLDGLKIGV